ncbi:MAG: C_GCAxxG_C_C family protein [Ruminococcaceae bacterium]|nr:C_GCAxxG_C_C family protein [Oscillospiraceae bacterium]
MSIKGQKARELFLQGYNCAQAVACAFANEMGLPSDTVARMVSGFGGGMGRLREVCGAFSGAVFVMSVLYGYADAAAQEEKMRLYADIREMAEGFRLENGSLICRELLETRASAATTSGHNPLCGAMVESAAAWMETFLREHPIG